ncbi:MAG TPA: cupin domain-containing protein [Chloroflexota bacterium]|nr:cupin domain-containing protein [Chloroflexota bacterium]
MDVLGLDQALTELQPLTAEISVRLWQRGATYEAGLIAFHPQPVADPRQICHADRDLLCQVLRGHGRLRLGAQQVPVAPGLLCRIPAGTPHDFAAQGPEPLVLFYALIKVS